MKEIVNNLNSSVNNNNKSLEWRRSKVLELASQGYNQSEISRILQISQPTINRDISYMRQQSKENIKKYVDERLPEEYEKCLVGITAILREAWTTSQQAEDRREKIQALSLAKECYSMKLDMLTNATVIDDAIRFVSERSKGEEKRQELSISPSSKENEGLKEHDCCDKQGGGEEEEKQKKKTGEITVNQVF
jgi:hypothetical protein